SRESACAWLAFEGGRHKRGEDPPCAASGAGRPGKVAAATATFAECASFLTALAYASLTASGSRRTQGVWRFQGRNAAVETTLGARDGNVVRGCSLGCASLCRARWIARLRLHGGDD